MQNHGDDATSQRRLGPILLAPGVSPWQIGVFLLVICTAIIAERFAQLIQPLILTQQIGIAADQQGVITGALESVKQAAILIFIGLAGALADRWGRRTVLMIAVGGFGLCYLTYPWMSALWAFFILRFVWGICYTGWLAGGATKMMDYPDNSSRGKFISLMLLTQAGFGALFLAFVGSRMLGWFEGWGLSTQDALRLGFGIMAGIAFFGAAIALFFLKPDGVGRGSVKTRTNPLREMVGIVGNMREVFAHARTNPRFGLTILIGLVIRTDTVIVYSFLTLWVVSASQLQGVSAIDATRTAGTLLAILSTAQFLTPPLFGFLADKFDRMTMLLVGLGLTSIAFVSFAFVDDVTGTMMIVAVVLIGLAEGCQTISAQSLFGQEAPEHIRGSAQGVFSFLGVCSVLFVNLLGGYLFDAVGFKAPFMMEAVLHFLFLVAGLTIVILQARKRRALARSAGV